MMIWKQYLTTYLQAFYRIYTLQKENAGSAAPSASFKIRDLPPPRASIWIRMKETLAPGWKWPRQMEQAEDTFAASWAKGREALLTG